MFRIIVLLECPVGVKMKIFCRLLDVVFQNWDVLLLLLQDCQAHLPLNKHAVSAFILTKQSMGEFSMVVLGHSGYLFIFTLLKHLMMFLK